MAKRRIIVASVVCLLIEVLTVQTLSQTRRSNRGTRPPSPPEDWRSKTAKEMEEETKISIEQAKQGRREFTFEKLALGVTEEQWKVIKPKLEKVQHLRSQADIWAKIVAFGTSTSNSAGSAKSGTQKRPNVQWMKSWEGKAPGELTEGERIAEDLIKFVENKNAGDEQVKMKLEALWKYKQQAQKELPKTLEELRNGLTTRQEAMLVLRVGWL